MKLKIVYDETLPDDLNILQAQKHHKLIDKAAELFENPYPTDVFIAQDGSEFTPISYDDIHYIFTETKEVFLKTADGKHRIKERLYEVEKLLPHHFIRISRFEVVNLKWVKRFEYTFGGKIMLHLKNGQALYTTKSYTRSIKEILFRK